MPDLLDSILAVVQYSGGVSSWGAAMRAVERFGADRVVLLFADTKTEDEDLYRFLRESAALTGAPLYEIADGRNVWEVFRDSRFIGNSRIDPCSRILKREICEKWCAAAAPKAVRVLGLDWMEMHRVERTTKAFAERGVTAWCPMADRPLVTRIELQAQLRDLGVAPPRLYGMGFPHNNCGGFCVKAGHAQFRLLLRTMPERYAYHEAKEQEIRDLLGADVSVLRDRSGGKSEPMTMREFRERVDRGEPTDPLDFGGCDCFAVTNDGGGEA